MNEEIKRLSDLAMTADVETVQPTNELAIIRAHERIMSGEDIPTDNIVNTYRVDTPLDFIDAVIGEEGSEQERVLVTSMLQHRLKAFFTDLEFDSLENRALRNSILGLQYAYSQQGALRAYLILRTFKYYVAEIDLDKTASTAAHGDIQTMFLQSIIDKYPELSTAELPREFESLPFVD